MSKNRCNHCQKYFRYTELRLLIQEILKKCLNKKGKLKRLNINKTLTPIKTNLRPLNILLKILLNLDTEYNRKRFLINEDKDHPWILSPSGGLGLWPEKTFTTRGKTHIRKVLKFTFSLYKCFSGGTVQDFS